MELYIIGLLLIVAVHIKHATATFNSATWTPLNGNCYKLFPGGTFNESRQLCEEQNAVLASVPNQEVMDMLISMMGEIGRASPNAWIGLKKRELDSSCTTLQCKRQPWQWLDGTPYTYELEGDWHKWASTEPTGDSNCARVRLEGKVWMDIKCSTKYSCICQKDAASCGETSTLSTPTTAITTATPTTTTTTTTTTKPTTTTTTVTTTTTTTPRSPTPPPLTTAPLTTSTLAPPTTSASTSAASTTTLAPWPSPPSTSPSSSWTIRPDDTTQVDSTTAAFVTMDPEELERAWKQHDNLKIVLIVVYCVVAALLVWVLVEVFLVLWKQGNVPQWKPKFPRKPRLPKLLRKKPQPPPSADMEARVPPKRQYSDEVSF